METDKNVTNPQANDPAATPATDPAPKNDPPKDDPPKEPTTQELMVEIAKLKRATDKATAEAAEYKRKYKETLSTQEQANMDKAEAEARRDEEFKSLQRKVKINEYTAQFMKLGYGDSAEKAATAQVDGDTDALFQIQQEVQEKLIKDREAEWLKTRPQVSSGGGDGKADDPFLKGFMGK